MENDRSFAKITNNWERAHRIFTVNHRTSPLQSRQTEFSCTPKLQPFANKKKKRKKNIPSPNSRANFSPPVYGLADACTRVRVHHQPCSCKWPFKFTGPSATQGVTSLIELVPVWPAERARLIRLSENFECPGNFALSPQTSTDLLSAAKTIFHHPFSLYIYFFFPLYSPRRNRKERHGGRNLDGFASESGSLHPPPMAGSAASARMKERQRFARATLSIYPP